MKILETFTLFDSELPSTTGIYRIYNKINGKQYIGSARANRNIPSGKGFKARFCNGPRSHRSMLINGNHHCSHLQNSYNKVIESGLHPNDVFEIHILEYVEISMCLIREQWYLDNCKNKYNTSKLARGGVTEWTSEMRAKASKRMKGYSPSAATRALLSRPKSDEHKRKIAEAHRGKPKKKGYKMTDEQRRAHGERRKGKKLSLESRQKQSEAKKGKPQPHLEKKFIGISPLGEIYYFTGATKFSEEHTLTISGISSCATGKRKHYKEWFFFYADDPRITVKFLEELVYKQKESQKPKYIGVSPLGEVFYFSSISDFAEAHQLTHVGIDHCLRKIQKTHAKWSFYSASEITPDLLNEVVESKRSLAKPWHVAISPDGEKTYFHRIVDFCKGTEFTPGGISGCLNGRLKTHRGWMFMEYQDELAA